MVGYYSHRQEQWLPNQFHFLIEYLSVNHLTQPLEVGS